MAYYIKNPRALHKEQTIFDIIFQMAKKLIILGVTGSIGRNAVDIVLSHPDEFSVAAVAALRSKDACEDLARRLGAKAYVGEDAAVRAVEENDADICLVATVGLSGLKPTLAAIAKGMDIALATKEVMVMAGELVTREARRAGVRFLPVDSEHSAIFQSMAGRDKSELRRILLTGSGGPFRGWTPEQTKDVTPERAVRHPNWSMGAKISIDSATMMNKGLEFIEAMHLFAVTPEQIRVVIHPESAIHSMVELLDGTVIAQLGVPDMGLPIQYALTYPERRESAAKPMDFAALGSMHFEDPDLDKLPCLRLAMECARARGTAPCVLSAANEIAVGAFLGHRIGYNDIYRVVASAVERAEFIAQPTLEEILASDAQARELVRREIG